MPITYPISVAQAFRLKSRGTVAEVMQVEGVHESEVSMEVVRRNHKPWKQCRDMLQPRSGAGTVTLGNHSYQFLLVWVTCSVPCRFLNAINLLHL